MALMNYMLGEYIDGKVIEKYRLDNGNIGLVVQQTGTNKRYHVQFKDSYREPALENLYGLLSDPFTGKTDTVDKLVNKGDSIGVTVSYSRSPFRKAYKIHSVSAAGYKASPYPARLPYRPAKAARY